MNLNEYFKKIYTIAFRLTGEELQASNMAILAIERTATINSSENVSSNMLLYTAKEVCRIFLLEFEEQNEQYITTIEPMQNALLSLEPLNRATIVWRDILGFKIDDLALTVDCSKQELYRELNNARMQIKMQL
ncbi:MAG: hypothetical protein SA378_03785 [Sedimentibacter sp.]|uniref:hypothetical protein n=1 Tax=Sedimentibacter sp. TaxID=1960295 RepID=UPI00298107C3|nr:hypothetical protein [Sedimentibacter sp.]MDW5299243.1 hypothetical protein [Sedimentibacter sp.]